jgi:uncharacterized protein (TIGR03437 family)
MSFLAEIAKYAAARLSVLCLMSWSAFQAHGQPCSKSSLSGTYFLLQQGAYLSSGSPVPVSALEEIVADGNGGVTGTSTVHAGIAEVETASLSGTYNVNGDCSGALTVTITPQSGSPQTSTSAFQLAQGGQELIGLKTQTADVETSVAYRGPAQCSTASLKGSYAFSQTGMNITPNFDVYSIVSAITFDGNGGLAFQGTENEMLGAGSFPFTGTGTYSIASDCSGTMSLPPHNRNTIALVQGGRVLGIEIDSNEYTAIDILEPVSAVTVSSVISAGAYGAFPAASPGSWVEIYGSNLAPDTRQWAGSDFNGNNAPTSLDGVQVALGGQKAFVDYISSSPGQINAQLPSNIPTGGTLPLTVTNGVLASAPFNIAVKNTAPGLLAPAAFQIGGKQYVVALLPDGATYILPAGAIAGVLSRPAHPNETITMYGIGFGAVTPSISAGEIETQTNQLASPIQILFGQTPGQISYAGLAPGFVGLYQFNVVVPTVPDSDLVPLSFNLGGTAGSQTLYTAVHQ